VTGKIELPIEKDEKETKAVIELGKNQAFTVELESPIALEENISFIIREGKKTIAGGRITEIIE